MCLRTCKRCNKNYITTQKYSKVCSECNNTIGKTRKPIDYNFYFDKWMAGINNDD